MSRAWWVYGLLLAGFVGGAAKAQAQAPIRDNRSIETATEFAWMADPITFPYELHAYLKNGVLEIHGIVPSVFIRRHVLNIARLYAPAAALDRTELKADSAKTFIAAPSEKVQTACQERIARALPQLAAAVRVDCDSEGRVTLTGGASTDAEKIVLAEIMRRVPGCLCVDNRVQAGAIPAAPSRPATPVRVVRHGSPTPPANAAALFDRPITNDDTEQMRQKLVVLCPRAGGVYVNQLGPRRFQIQFAARDEDEAGRFAIRIFEQQEWKQFQLDIGARVPQ